MRLADQRPVELTALSGRSCNDSPTRNDSYAFIEMSHSSASF